jgi:hypothetical protein
MARLAAGDAVGSGLLTPGWPPRDFRAWLRGNGLLDSDFGVPPADWVPPVTPDTRNISDNATA